MKVVLVSFLAVAIFASCSAIDSRTLGALNEYNVNLGRYNVGQYNPAIYNQRDYNDGRYNPDNSGAYRGGDDGRYRGGNDGRYTQTAQRVVLVAPPQPQPQPQPQRKVQLIQPVYQPQTRYTGEGRWAILRDERQSSPDGDYSYAYETENGIRAAEQSQQQNKGTDAETSKKSGSFEYTGDDGNLYRVDYLADENGFQPQAAHLPTPPPIPEAILRSLEFNARNAPAQ